MQKDISRFKNSFLSPEKVLQMEGHYTRRLGEVYKKYQKYLWDQNLVDFDDLLLLTYQILEENPQLTEEVSRRYNYIMVDEYQDTNEIQLLLLKKLCSTHNNICVVGDDDQAIYGFRGANHKNILNFEKMFGAKVIKLELNYRSRQPILTVANNLISYNRNRYRKVLKATREGGKEVEVLELANEKAEAMEIGRRVKKLLEQGVAPSQIAILYRINALSRALEDGLRSLNIPYKLVGGVRFYEREEIKDLISYLRLIANPDDDYSFLRVINKPRRGIGKATIEKLKKAKGDKHFLPFLWEGNLENFSPKIRKSLHYFGEALRELRELPLEEIPSALEELFNFSDSYENEEKKFNIAEFYGLIRENGEMSLREFLNELSLESEQDHIGGQMINLMTIHAAKGLEFDYLFVIGWEEDYFPLENGDIEEERRLAYVAITRAREELVLSSVKSRYLHGRRKDMEQSRFLVEAGLKREGKILYKREREEQGKIKIGTLVKHPVFGRGKVIGMNRAGKNWKLTIDFGGTKREILSNFVEKI
jgi:DNA helicase-2/ATP-dependent DNA helicase PcrA